jgi:phosphatidylglycerol:prolipoprotein diacylglycerol transferase
MIAFLPSRTVAVELFGFAVHWYGLMYLAAFLLAWWMLPRLQKFRGIALSSEAWGDILTAAILGVILGGRLGFVLLYAPQFYLAHPVEILKVWRGGMASHGGFLGVTLALLWILRGRSREEILRIADIVVVPVALGLALGRVGNFINGELYGSVSTLPWAMAFPEAEGLRHPWPLYAVLKDLCIAALCSLSLRWSSVPGKTTSLFLVLYAILRFALEWLRDQPYGWVEAGPIALSWGQMYCIPILFIGMGLWLHVRKNADVGPRT